MKNSGQVKSVDADEVPVIDITALRDGSNCKVVAKALHKASQELGFIYIKGHGIGDSVIKNARECALSFFHSPVTDKQELNISARHRGWLGQGGAKMQDDAKADLKESFIWGLEDASGHTDEDHPLRGNNQWPGFIPEMQINSMCWFHQAHNVARHLLKGFALGLDLDENFFLQHCKRPLSRASYVYYPPQSTTTRGERFGVGPHTDFGVLTILCQDSVGGLQIKNAQDEWIQAPPIEQTLIVNVADLLSRWTDGAYKSTPHRVINASGRERLSLVLAFDPDPETVIDARMVYGIDHKPGQPPTTCGDYLQWRFEKAFAYRKP